MARHVKSSPLPVKIPQSLLPLPNKKRFCWLSLPPIFLRRWPMPKLIRNLSDGRRAIPIIAMTANAFDEDRQKALSVGMDAHLAKPVDVKRLFGTLRKVIR